MRKRAPKGDTQYDHRVASFPGSSLIPSVSQGPVSAFARKGEVSPCAKADPFGIAPSGDLARSRYYSSC